MEKLINQWNEYMPGFSEATICNILMKKGSAFRNIG